MNTFVVAVLNSYDFILSLYSQHNYTDSCTTDRGGIGTLKDLIDV